MFSNSFGSKKDIKLYYNTHIYTPSYLGIERNIEWDVSEEVKSTPIDDKVVGYLNTLANKVVKYLLTTRGSDIINPEYGGYGSSRTWIHEGFRARYIQELQNDIKRCTEYIQSKETPGPNNERLRTIIMEKIEYTPTHKPTDIHIYLRILTTQGNVAVLSFNRHRQPEHF